MISASEARKMSETNAHVINAERVDKLLAILDQQVSKYTGYGHYTLVHVLDEVLSDEVKDLLRQELIELGYRVIIEKTSHYDDGTYTKIELVW